jgi:hypothetical protein
MLFTRVGLGGLYKKFVLQQQIPFSIDTTNAAKQQDSDVKKPLS